MKKKIISITSDLSTDDYYLGMLKGYLLSITTDIHIVDLNVNVPQYDYLNAAMSVMYSYRAFPEGTIHLIVVNTDTETSNPPVLVYADNQFFIAPDNGILSLVFENVKKSIYKININTSKPTYNFFTEIQSLLVIIGNLVNERKMSKNLLTPVDNFTYELYKMQPEIVGDRLTGHVVYIDSFGNIITDISQQEFDKFAAGRHVTITMSEGIQCDKISCTYSEILGKSPNTPMFGFRTKPFAIFGIHGYLELGLFMADAATLGGIHVNSKVYVTRQL